MTSDFRPLAPDKVERIVTDDHDSPQASSKISVLLPVMNEVVSLNRTIQIIDEENPDRNFEYIIILSHRSDPEAVENAETLACAIPSRARIIVQDRPLLGGALMDGIQASTGERLIMMASDLETDPHAVQELLNVSDHRPGLIIATTRWRGRDAGFEGYGSGKKWANKVFQRAIGWLFSTELTDLTYGFRLYPRDAINHYDWQTMNHGFLLESILRPLRQGWPATEIPVKWRAREEGISNNSWRFYASYFKMAMLIRFGAS
jgi:glycosyltransferase involved in cell wall biosynthesis